METDDGVVQIMNAIEEKGLPDNPLVIFSADNECSKAAGIEKLQKQGHYPSANLRGSKTDLWDGGHRVPFVVRWPGKIELGSTSDQLLCLTDLFATVTDILEQVVPENAAEDRDSFLPAFSHQPIESSRKGVIHHSISGHFAYRQDNWKLLLAYGSDGWTAPKENETRKNNASKAQLYDLDGDPGETTNLYEEKPENAKRLLEQLKLDVNSGKSTAEED